MARKRGRQDLSAYVETEESVEVLARRPSRVKRNRSWEARQRKAGVVVTYRGIPPDLQKRLKRVAEAHSVPVGEVARRFLEHGLAAYEAGELVLQPVLVPGRLTLYPEPAGDRGKVRWSDDAAGG